MHTNLQHARPRHPLTGTWAAVAIIGVCIVFGCSAKPEGESATAQASTPTGNAPEPVSSQKPASDATPARPKNDLPHDASDPLGSLFGTALRVVDKAAQVAADGADEKSLQDLIETSADGIRAGLDVADDVLPPLDSNVAKSFGDTFRDSVLASHKRITDQDAVDLVIPIWTEVMVASGERPGSVTITLVEDPEMNAFAFVGRNVVVNRGFIDFARKCTRTKDVIRFTLAHELGHIVCGHTDALFRRLAAADKIAPGAGVAPVIVESIVKQTPISQAAEREADCFARKLHVANNWSLDGAKEFFARVQQISGRPSSGVAIESLFGSHPDEKRRLELLENGSGCDGN